MDNFMHLEESRNKLDEQGEKAMALIQKGKFRSASKILIQLQKSFFVADVVRISVPLQALMYVYKHKTRKARELIRLNLAMLWNSPLALKIMRSQNDTPNSNSKYFLLKVKGGCAMPGPFIKFGDKHITTVEVLADDEFEAIRFLDELSFFARPRTRVVLQCRELEPLPDEFIDRKGVYFTYPFTLADSTESTQAVAADDVV